MPRGRTLAVVVAAGLTGQLGGNVLFQWALSVIGISLTVPLCLGAIILSSTVLGRMWLNEGVSGRTLISIALLIGSIWILSLGAREAAASGHNTLPPAGHADPAAGPGTVLVGGAVLAACASGLAYALLGVAIRRSIISGTSVTGTIWTVAVTGVMSLALLAQARLGVAGILATSGHDLQVMVTAGTCNFIAFLSLGRALKLTTLLYVNALNASQVAMAAVAGLWLFNEPSSAALLWGVGLTVGGLLFMPRPTTRPSDD